MRDVMPEASDGTRWLYLTRSFAIYRDDIVCLHIYWFHDWHAKGFFRFKTKITLAINKISSQSKNGLAMSLKKVYYKADSRFSPSQWETALFCNDFSHWLGASLESAMGYISDEPIFKPVHHYKVDCDTLWLRPSIVLKLVIYMILTYDWLSNCNANADHITGIARCSIR